MRSHKLIRAFECSKKILTTSCDTTVSLGYNKDRTSVFILRSLSGSVHPRVRLLTLDIIYGQLACGFIQLFQFG